MGNKSSTENGVGASRGSSSSPPPGSKSGSRNRDRKSQKPRKKRPERTTSKEKNSDSANRNILPTSKTISKQKFGPLQKKVSRKNDKVKNKSSSRLRQHKEKNGRSIYDNINTVPSSEVYLFEESCPDFEEGDDFTACCTYPYAPRYPPNPRPRRQWSPSVLPSTAYQSKVLGKPCRRCGKRVHLAELHLSSKGAYHSECFKCCLCGTSLDSWTIAEYKREIFCRACYRRNFAIHGCGFGLGAGALQTQ